MTHKRVTVTIDREKVDHARRLTGVDSISGVLNVALDHFVRFQGLREDILAYRRRPQTEEERALDGFAETAGLHDDTDWEALYAARTA